MFQFQAAAQDGFASGGCDVCCCTPMSAKAGETNLVRVDYTPWSLPLNGRGLTGNTGFELEKIKSCAASGGNQPPVVPPTLVVTPFQTPLAGTLATGVLDPESDALTYKGMPLYGPTNGSVVISSDGSYVYTPAVGFTGYDHFFYSVSDGTHTVVQEAVIAVSPALPLPPLAVPTASRLQAAVTIDQANVSVNQANHFLQFPLTVSPIAKPGEVYRLTVRQGAANCDGFCYFHVSCYDILISKC